MHDWHYYPDDEERSRKLDEMRARQEKDRKAKIKQPQNTPLKTKDLYADVLCSYCEQPFCCQKSIAERCSRSFERLFCCEECRINYESKGKE